MSYETDIAQVEEEISAFVNLLVMENVKSYLEIGSKFGGSLWRVGKALPRRSRIVAVDMPLGTKMWKQSEASLVECISALEDTFEHEARVIWGDSTAQSVIAQARRFGPYDAIFIDANHTRRFLEADWKNYGPMGRIVAFHDIAWHREPNWDPGRLRIDAPEFWNSIKPGFRHEEFKFDPSGKNNGIGVLWRY